MSVETCGQEDGSWSLTQVDNNVHQTAMCKLLLPGRRWESGLGLCTANLEQAPRFVPACDGALTRLARTSRCFDFETRREMSGLCRAGVGLRSVEDASLLRLQPFRRQSLSNPVAFPGAGWFQELLLHASDAHVCSGFSLLRSSLGGWKGRGRRGLRLQVYLRSCQKGSNVEGGVLKKRFVYESVFVGEVRTWRALRSLGFRWSG